MAGKLAQVGYSLVEASIAGIPGGLGRRIRSVYYRRRLRHLGAGVVIDVGVRIENPEWVSIGDNTWIDSYAIILAGPPGGEARITRTPNPAYRHGEGEVVIGRNCHVANFVVLQGHGGLSVGDDTTVASGCKVYSMSHHYADPARPEDRTVYKFSSMAPPGEQSLVVSPVVIEASSALGLNSVVLPGAVLERGSWVGANATVTKRIPAGSLAVGSPARVLREIPGRSGG